jgi:hypothetical protein
VFSTGSTLIALTRRAGGRRTVRRRKSVGGTYDEHRQQRGAQTKDCTHSLRRHRASAVPPCPGGDSDRLGAEARASTSNSAARATGRSVGHRDWRLECYKGQVAPFPRPELCRVNVRQIESPTVSCSIANARPHCCILGRMWTACPRKGRRRSESAVTLGGALGKP